MGLFVFAAQLTLFLTLRMHTFSILCVSFGLRLQARSFIVADVVVVVFSGLRLKQHTQTIWKMTK